MHFAFTEDQLLLRDAVRAVLAGECSGTVVRQAWANADGRGGTLWRTLADNGVLGVLAPERLGGLGLSELDQVLLLEEAGYAGVPEPLLETAAVAVPTLVGTAAEGLVPGLVDGSAAATLSVASAPHAPYADTCTIVLAQHGDTVFAVERAAARLRPRTSVDRTRRLFDLEFDPSDATPVCQIGAVELRANLAASAMLVGLGRRMLEMAVEYAKVRTQFGKAIGAFQAVQHRLADALLGLEFAAPVVHRAAWSLAESDPEVGVHVSMAKVFAAEAATRTAKASLQVHGAIGYSTEYDLHLFMKRAWALSSAYGDARAHRRRLAAHLLD